MEEHIYNFIKRKGVNYIYHKLHLCYSSFWPLFPLISDYKIGPPAVTVSEKQ